MTQVPLSQVRIQACLMDETMAAFQFADPDFEARVRASFGRQRIMEAIGASLSRVAPGEVQIDLPIRDILTQQHGYVHAGIVTAIADSACGYAALTLLPSGTEVLTVEYKVNFLAPARGTRLVACGRVIRPGRTIAVCRGEVSAVDGTTRVVVASMLATMIRSKPT
ncbi:MAG TPA: PaaI family thioesterase [bacterium]|nr:PaaI family thioesterase [bacterium]